MEFKLCSKYRITFCLSQYSFDEGRIVELNNQAKHFVTNGSADTHRVHLIFDYVDDHPIKQRFLLQPGEKVYQTRRSIDLEREVHDAEVERRKAPTFVIIGAQVRLCLFVTLFVEQPLFAVILICSKWTAFFIYVYQRWYIFFHTY